MIECSVQFLDEDTAGIRMVAHRLNENGFLAIQKPDDSVEVFTLPAYDLGAAIAGSVELTGPGSKPEIVIPEYARPEPPNNDDELVSVQQSISARALNTVPRAGLRVFARAQSHYQPSRDWGFDRSKSAVVWVRPNDDGEYLYTPDLSCAKPMNARQLSDRIDGLIAKDVKTLREQRGR